MIKRFLSFETVMIAGILLFSGLFFGWTYTFPETAALLPRLVSFVMICLALLYIVIKVVEAKKPQDSRQRKEKFGQEESEGRSDLNQGISWQISSLLMFGFMVLIYLLGFGPATFICGVMVPYLLGYRNYMVAVPFAAGMTAIIVLGFGKLFMIPLPVGLLWEFILK